MCDKMTNICNRVLRENIYLIGYCTNALAGSKLPSKKEVMKVLFFNLRVVKLGLRESAKLVVEELLIFWEKARIPTRDKQHCIIMLEHLHGEWRNLKKSSAKKSEFQRNKKINWVENLEQLFDVAHANALDLIKIEDDKAFLLSQRQKGRPGFMYGIDFNELQIESQIEHRQQIISKRVERSEREINIINETVQLESSSESDASFDTIKSDDVFVQVPKKKAKGKQNIMTSKLSIALDYCKISDRNAVHIISAVLEALGKDIADFIVNRSSIHVSREKMRKDRATALRNTFTLNKEDAISLHWDGKLLPALTGYEKVDRLPIIICSGETEQLLDVPALNYGSGKEQADAVYNTICKWGLQKEIKCLVFDTTVVNTGCYNGTCTLIEKSLNRELLWLPCRHHIYEIVLRCVFENKFDQKASPNVKLFENFKKSWSKLNISHWSSGIQDEVVKTHLQKSKVRITGFIYSILEKKQPREDYKELLELALLFLGENLKKSQKSVIIRAPGAFHHARWMAKAIYSIKIFLLREEFCLPERELADLRHICIFIVAVYTEAWFSAPSAIQAPNIDFSFLTKLQDFEKIDADISAVTIKKFKNHLWYLGSEAIAFAFFDDKVAHETKKKMKTALNIQNEEIVKRAMLKSQIITETINNGLEQFISSKTVSFFERFNIDKSFLELDPSIWPTHDAYKTAVKVLKTLKVVNDVAERGVKLIEDYNKILTKNEDQKQFLLQVVNNYRKRFPDSRKSTLSQML